MSKYLLLGTEPDHDAWLLPDDANVDQVRKEITEAMNEGRTTAITVVAGKRKTPGELVVNGRAVAAALVWETKSSEPTITIID